MVIVGKLTAFLLLMFMLSPANAIPFTANFNNLMFSGGETVNGSITYDDDPTCCTPTSGSITATGGIFTGETVVWNLADFFIFNNTDSIFAATKNTTLFTFATIVIRGAPGEWTTPGDFSFSPGTEVNRNGVLPNPFVSGTITISQATTVPEPPTLALFLLAGFTALVGVRASNREGSTL